MRISLSAKVNLHSRRHRSNDSRRRNPHGSVRPVWRSSVKLFTMALLRLYFYLSWDAATKLFYFSLSPSSKGTAIHPSRVDDDDLSVVYSAYCVHRDIVKWSNGVVQKLLRCKSIQSNDVP